MVLNQKMKMKRPSENKLHAEISHQKFLPEFVSHHPLAEAPSFIFRNNNLRPTL